MTGIIGIYNLVKTMASKREEKKLQKSTGKTGIELALKDIDFVLELALAQEDSRMYNLLMEIKSHLMGL
jgi:hypothetical protein